MREGRAFFAASAAEWRPTSPVGGVDSWPLIDRIGYRAAWAAGISLCLIAVAIVLYMAVKGVQFLSLELFTQSPVADIDQSKSGGFLDPLVGTVILTVLGTAIAAPLGICAAMWLSEYGRPGWLARAVESGIEVVAGTPTIVLAIFGLLVFQQQIFEFLSFTAFGDAVFGRSFLIAGTMMSLIALPLVVGATREALESVPGHVREASYALGKTKAATIRRVLMPAARPGIGTGVALGMGRIAGDTAIVIILLGNSLRLDEGTGFPLIGDLRGTGSTLTSYVFVNSPAGEGNAPEKAYAAAFVLLLIVIALNYSIDRIARGRRIPAWTR